MPEFQLVSEFVPTGDQPEAIAALAALIAAVSLPRRFVGMTSQARKNHAERGWEQYSLATIQRTGRRVVSMTKAGSTGLRWLQTITPPWSAPSDSRPWTSARQSNRPIARFVR